MNLEKYKINGNRGYDLINIKEFLKDNSYRYIEEFEIFWKKYIETKPPMNHADDDAFINYYYDGKITMEIKDLYFHKEQEIGYNKSIGLEHTHWRGLIERPIGVIKYISETDIKYVITDGYHRIFNHLYNDKSKIKCWIKIIKWN